MLFPPSDFQFLLGIFLDFARDPGYARDPGTNTTHSTIAAAVKSGGDMANILLAKIKSCQTFHLWGGGGNVDPRKTRCKKSKKKEKRRCRKINKHKKNVSCMAISSWHSMEGALTKFLNLLENVFSGTIFWWSSLRFWEHVDSKIMHLAGEKNQNFPKLKCPKFGKTVWSQGKIASQCAFCSV